jgi:hypothetical protein
MIVLKTIRRVVHSMIIKVVTTSFQLRHVFVAAALREVS